MADAIKEIYNRDYLQKLAADMQVVHPPFDTEAFISSVMDETWHCLELKQRMRQITISLGKFLPANYVDAINIIDQVIAGHGTWLDGFCLYFCDFVEVFGQGEQHWDISMAALERYTVHASAEFAVRPFIINHEARMMAQMQTWANSDNPHVRRLASEGCRPALPWGQALNRFKKDPAPILPILEQLKADPDLYVRKSVANNLNDISKTHPALVVQTVKAWHGQNPLTDWVIKHACRTLLKKANPEALALFGFHNADSVSINDFALSQPQVSIGESFTFSFTVKTAEATKVRLEYAIDFMKANGKPGRKIFQISESQAKANETKRYTKSHSFANLSTRKHYPGQHAITLIVNGTERGLQGFDVLE